MSENNEESDDKDLVFESSKEKPSRRPPLFKNDDHGITGWIDEDKNGNYFIRLRLPLGLGTVPIFVNDIEYKGLQENFDKLVKHQIEED